MSEAVCGVTLSPTEMNKTEKYENENKNENVDRKIKKNNKIEIEIKNKDKLEITHCKRSNDKEDSVIIEEEHPFISTSSAEKSSFPSFRILTKPIDLLRITKILHTHFEERSSGISLDKEHSLGITLNIPLTRKAQVC